MRVRAKAPDLGDLSRDLRRAGRRDLQKELYSGLNRSTKGVRVAIKSAWAAELPQRGGLAAKVARSSVTVRQRGPRVRIVPRGTKRSVGQLDSIEAGEVRHPTYGHDPWRRQPVRPGIFADTAKDHADAHTMDELLDAIETVARKLAAG